MMTKKKRLLFMVMVSVILVSFSSGSLAQEKKKTGSSKVYCCKNGKITPTTFLRCKRNNGRPYKTMASAKENCAPPDVYCCVDQKIEKMTEAECKKAGKPFETASAARRACRPKVVYCCVDRRLRKVTEEACKEGGGKIFKSASAAKNNCKPEQIFCCVNGQVTKMTADRCKEKNGRPNQTAPEAKQNCRRAPRSPRTRSEPTAAPKKQSAKSKVKTYPGVKLNQGPPTLPQAVVPRAKGIGSVQPPPNLGRSVNALGSAGKDIGQKNNLGGKLPEGHTAPGAGFGKRGGAAGLAKGVNTRQGIGTASEELAEQMGPVIKTGAGAHVQGMPTGEEDAQESSGGMKQGPQVHDEMDFSVDVPALLDQALWMKIYDEETIPYMGYLYPDEEKKVTEDTDFISELLDWNDPIEERTVEGDPGDESGNEQAIDPERIKAITSQGPGVRYPEGEEPGQGGVYPGNLRDIAGSKVQVKTIDGLDTSSATFEDISEQTKKIIEQEGHSPVDE